jgi:hypothetical protein
VNDRFDYTMPAGALTGADDGFHTPDGHDWWEMETLWLWFFVPERKLGVWLYHYIRPNIGIDAGSVQVWDGASLHHTDAPYFRTICAGQLAEHRDMRDHTFSTGFRWTAVEALQRYRLRFSDDDVLAFDLDWNAIMDPWVPPKDGPTSGLRGWEGASAVKHLDQFGHITGKLTVHGETMDVDCYAMRDRSWQVSRPEDVSPPFWSGDAFGGYMAAAADPSTAFFGTRFVVLDGHLSPLVDTVVRRERDREHGYLRRLVITGKDAEGREFEADGTTVSRMIVPFPAYQGLSVNSLVDYRINGIQAWGDDQDSWSNGTWSAMRRKQMGLRDVRTSPEHCG